jgi:hypothetical protein
MQDDAEAFLFFPGSFGAKIRCRFRVRGVWKRMGEFR